MWKENHFERTEKRLKDNIKTYLKNVGYNNWSTCDCLKTAPSGGFCKHDNPVSRFHKGREPFCLPGNPNCDGNQVNFRQTVKMF
jgi:hypothetical protein